MKNLDYIESILELLEKKLQLSRRGFSKIKELYHEWRDHRS
jgi:hypothetical protein